MILDWFPSPSGQLSLFRIAGRYLPDLQINLEDRRLYARGPSCQPCPTHPRKSKLVRLCSSRETDGLLRRLGDRWTWRPLGRTEDQSGIRSCVPTAWQ